VSFLGGHIMTVDGQVVGGWTRSFRGKKLIVKLKGPSTFDSVERRSIEKQVQRFGTFLGTEAELEQRSP
jgi:hypothetical protein